MNNNTDTSFLIAQAAQATGGAPASPAAAVHTGGPSSATIGTTTATTSATAKPGEPPQGMFGQMSTLALPLLLIVFFYFILIRPQNKKEKVRQQMLKGINKGDKVLTRGGIYGVVIGVRPDENIAIVKIADDVKVEVAISTIDAVITGNQPVKS